MDNDGDDLIYEVAFNDGTVNVVEASKIRVLDEAEDATGRWIHRRVEFTFQTDEEEEPFIGLHTARTHTNESIISVGIKLTCVSGEVIEHDRRDRFVVRWADGGPNTKQKLPAVGAVLLAKAAAAPEQEPADEDDEDSDEDSEGDDEDDSNEGDEENMQQSDESGDDSEKTEADGVEEYDGDASKVVVVNTEENDSDYDMDDSN
jgi:hypothetical protein